MRRTNHQNRFKTAKILAILVVGLLSTGQVQAATIAGVEFPKNFQDEGITMELQGVGLKSVVFVKAFAAGLYKEEGVDIDTAAKKIKVRYFVKIPGKKLSNFTIDSMKDNITKSEFRSLNEEIAQMTQYFVDLKPGDTFELLYIPEVGTKFVHNGELKGIIQGAEFSRALYAVWIGKKPFDKKLKQQILGGEDNSTTRSGKFAKI